MSPRSKSGEKHLWCWSNIKEGKNPMCLLQKTNPEEVERRTANTADKAGERGICKWIFFFLFSKVTCESTMGCSKCTNCSALDGNTTCIAKSWSQVRAWSVIYEVTHGMMSKRNSETKYELTANTIYACTWALMVISVYTYTSSTF